MIPLLVATATVSIVLVSVYHYRRLPIPLSQLAEALESLRSVQSRPDLSR